MNSTDAQRQQLASYIQAHPEIAQALVAQSQQPGFTFAGKNGAPTKPTQAQVLAKFGITLPGDAYIGVDPKTGQTTVQHQSWFARNANWVVPLATFATAGVAGGLFGGGSAVAPAGSSAVGSSAAGGTTAATVAADGTPFVAGPVAGTGLAGVDTAGLTAPAVGSSLWKTIATAAIPAGAELASAKIQTDANSKAAQIQADQADRALAQAKQIYETNRADLAPYRAEGVSSLAALNSHLGLPTAGPSMGSPAPPGGINGGALITNTSAAPRSFATTGSPVGNGTPPTPQPSTLASLGPQAAGQTPDPLVNMISPQGNPGQVPQSKVQQAIAAGGRLA